MISDSSFPMDNVAFDGVRFNSPTNDDYFKCEDVQGKALGDTWPVSSCSGFEDLVTSTEIED